MSARKSPSLEAIEAFVLAARNGSFQAAADQLALSPSALSRRIQRLEAFLGRPLFDRSGATPRLNPSGADYRREIEPSMEAILLATARLRERSLGERLRIVASHSLALDWLMPRLAGLQEAAGTPVDVHVGREVTSLRSGDVDLAIWGDPDQARDYLSDELARLDGVPISACRMADGSPPPRDEQELKSFPLLRAKNATNLWLDWLMGVPDSAGPFTFREVETTHFAYEGAASGLGVALGVPMLADRLTRDERVQPCFDRRAPVSVQYRLIYARDDLRRRADVRRLREWLQKEAASSSRIFDQWVSKNSSGIPAS